MMDVLLTDQVAVADNGEVVLCPHGLRLEAVEVAGEVHEPFVVLRVAFSLPVDQCSVNGWQISFETTKCPEPKFSQRDKAHPQDSLGGGDEMREHICYLMSSARLAMTGVMVLLMKAAVLSR